VCISGRKTQVWRAIQVTDLDRLEEKEIVLKDIWLNKNSLTKKKKSRFNLWKLIKYSKKEIKVV